MRASKLYKYTQPYVERYQRAAMCGLVLAVVANVLMLTCISPSFLLHNHFSSKEYLTDTAYVGHVVAKDYVKESPDILFLGGSSMRDALPPRDGGAAAFTQVCKVDVTMFAAATSSQHPTDGWAIIDALPEKSPRTIVVGLTYGRLMLQSALEPYDLSKQTVELPRSSTVFWDGVRRGNLSDGILDFFSQLRRLRWSIESIGQRLKGKSIPNGVSRDVHDRTSLPDSTIPIPEKQYLVEKMYAMWDDDYAKNARNMGKYWAQFANRMKARGSQVIFIWTPISDETEPLTRSYETETRAVMSTLAAAAPTLDLRKLPESSPDDFRDPLHVTIQGRSKTWPIMKRFIAAHGGCATGRNRKSELGNS